MNEKYNATQSNCEGRPPEIAVQYETMCKLLDDMEANLARLEERIKGVLSSYEQTQKTIEEEKAIPMASPLGGQLHTINSRILFLNKHITRIRESVEL